MTMSFEAAIGRVDQILQFQQQIQDPGSAASSAASGGAGLSSGSGTAASSSNFAAALAGAQAASDTAALNGLDSTDTSGDELTSGTDPLAGLASLNSLALSGITPSATATGVTGTGALGSVAGGETTSAADPSVQAMTDEANSLIGKPYVWGGGHSGWGPQAGYDCSGFVSAVLHAGGYLTSPQDTTTLPSAPGIEPGPGQVVTIYDRNESGQEGHVIIDIGGQFYESGGEAGAWGGGGGVESISTPSAAYLATFNDVLHPEGL